MLLLPLQARFLAVYAQSQAVLVAWRDLAAPQHAARAVVEAQQDVNVVVESATRHEPAQVCRQLARLEPGDEAREVVRVCADVAEAAARAGARGIDPPRGLLLPGVFQLGG